MLKKRVLLVSLIFAGFSVSQKVSAADDSDLIENRDIMINGRAKAIKNIGNYFTREGDKDVDRGLSFQAFSTRRHSFSGGKVGPYQYGDSLYRLEVLTDKKTNKLARISEFTRDETVNSKKAFPDRIVTNAFTDGNLTSRSTCQGQSEKGRWPLIPFFKVTDQELECVVVTPNFCRNLEAFFMPNGPGGGLENTASNLAACSDELAKVIGNDAFESAMKLDKEYAETVKKEERFLNDFQGNSIHGQTQGDSASLNVYKGIGTAENSKSLKAAFGYLAHATKAMENCRILMKKNPDAFDAAKSGSTKTSGTGK